MWIWNTEPFVRTICDNAIYSMCSVLLLLLCVSECLSSVCHLVMINLLSTAWQVLFHVCVMLCHVRLSLRCHCLAIQQYSPSVLMFSALR